MKNPESSSIILYDPATDSIVSRLPAHMFRWSADGALVSRKSGWPLASGKASTPEALKAIKANPSKWESIPGIVLLRRGLNPAPDGRILEEEDAFDASEVGKAFCARIRARAEERRRAEERTVRIHLSSRGWGDYSPVEWVGDITRPEAEIAAECRRALDGATDVDKRLSDAEIREAVAKARAAYDAKIAKREASAAHVEDCLRRARESGKPVEIEHYTTACHDPHEECDMDICTVWAMPDGTQKATYAHTW